MESSKKKSADVKSFLAGASASGGNLLSNGGVDNLGTRDMAFKTGESIGPWNVIAGKPLHAWARVKQVQAAEGITFCHLGYGSQQATISQPFSAISGAEYELSFLLHNLKSDDGVVRVVVKSASDAGKVFLAQDFAGEDTWGIKTATFTAGDSACIIEFTNINAAAMSIDKVVLVNTALNIFESESFTSVNEKDETSDAIAVALNKKPSSKVKLSLRPETDDIRLNKVSVGKGVELVFTKGNWNIPQIVIITAVDDDEIAEGVEHIDISISAKTDDAFYSVLDYSDLEIDVEVVDAANRYYGEFKVFANCQGTPFVLEKATHLSPCGEKWDIDGTINPSKWLPAFIRKDFTLSLQFLQMLNQL